MRAALVGLGLVLAPAHEASAHEMRPALMRVELAADGAVEISLRLPPQVPAGAAAALEPRLPAPCELAPATPPDAEIRRWRGRCAGGPPAGGELEVAGLGALERDLEVVVDLRRAGAAPTTALLRRGASTLALADAAAPAPIGYLGLGAEHIVAGLDHLAFVVGLVLLVAGAQAPGGRRWVALIAALTAFTAAHSLTLAAASLGWLRLRSAPVEAAIALSIVLLAREVVLAQRGGASSPTPARGRPWAFAFACGLLHGLGFAGALAEIGLPDGAIVPALLFFNLGVELGQLAVAALGVLALLVLRGEVLRRRAILSVGTVLGSIAAAWTIARVVAFWG